jgi:peptide/nickel transport system substrate-binding protein
MDANTAMNALMSGEIDYWEQVTPDLIEVLKKAPNVKIENLDPTGNMGWARFNHLVAPTNNPMVRQAIMKACKQDEFLKTAIGNPDYYKTCKSIYPCGTTYETDAGFVDQNLADAKTLLKQSGYNGEELVILQPTDHPVLNPFCQVLAEQIRAIGMNVKLQAMDWSTVLQRRASKEPTDKGGWNMFTTWWIGGDTVNPLTGVGFGATGEKGWFGWASDEEAIKMQDAFANAADCADAPPYISRFAAYEMARVPGREREAYDRLMALYNLGKKQQVPSLLAKIRELENKLNIPADQRIPAAGVSGSQPSR